MNNRFYVSQLVVLVLLLSLSFKAQAADINVTDYYAKVTASVLNIRSGPGTNRTVIGNLKRNHSVVVTHHNGSWKKIKYGYRSFGYVYGTYLKKNSSSANPIASETNVTDYSARVTASSLNVRSGPSTNRSPIGRVYRNQSVRVTHHAGVWRRISWRNGRSAYVHGNYIAKNQATIAAPQNCSGLHRNEGEPGGWMQVVTWTAGHYDYHGITSEYTMAVKDSHMPDIFSGVFGYEQERTVEIFNSCGQKLNDRHEVRYMALKRNHRCLQIRGLDVPASCQYAGDIIAEYPWREDRFTFKN